MRFQRIGLAMIRTLIISVCVVLIFLPCVSYAGMPLKEHHRLKIIEVVSCEKLTVENVSQVSSYVTRPRSNNWPDGTFTEWTSLSLEKFVQSNLGYVFKALVKETRDQIFNNISSKKEEDSGWKESVDTKPHYFYMPKNYYENAGLAENRGSTPGAVLTVVAPYGKSECDTYPPRGICAFNNPMKVVDSSCRQDDEKCN